MLEFNIHTLVFCASTSSKNVAVFTPHLHKYKQDRAGKRTKEKTGKGGSADALALYLGVVVLCLTFQVSCKDCLRFL